MEKERERFRQIGKDAKERKETADLNRKYIERLRRKVGKLKQGVESTKAAGAVCYGQLLARQDEQKTEIDRMGKMTEVLFDVLRKKDEEIFRLQSERNYLSLKVQGLV